MKPARKDDSSFEEQDENEDMNSRRERETKAAWASLRRRDVRKPVRSEDLPA